MINDYDGYDVLDVAGDKIGSVKRSFDDADGQVRYIEVVTGTLFHHHYVVPVDDSEVRDGNLVVPYTKTLIEHSPDASSVGETLGGDFLAHMQEYYRDIAPAPLHDAEDAPTDDTEAMPMGNGEVVGAASGNEGEA